jgi:hypothetical protein
VVRIIFGTRVALVMLVVLLLGADLEKVIAEVPGLVRCTALEREGRLIAQQFKRSKVCTESREIKGWTDCRMTAGGTEVGIYGALGTDVGSRTTGLLGSGFRLLGLDLRAPGHLEHRFRGKPNTHSGGSRTPIPGRSNALMG